MAVFTPMRPPVILTALLLTALLGGAALAQPAGAPKLRGKFTTPALTATPSPDAPPTADAGLRGPLDAPAPSSAAAPPAPVSRDDDGTPLQPPPPAAATPPGAGFVGGLPPGPSGGFAASALPTLPSLGPVGDPAPVCRAECSKTRAFCPASDDESCSAAWAQCIAACSDAAVR